jgi:hypothetical protein
LVASAFGYFADRVAVYAAEMGRITVAAEDDYAILNFIGDPDLAPDYDVFMDVDGAMNRLAQRWRFLLDFRGWDGVTVFEDHVAALHELAEWPVLVQPSLKRALEEELWTRFSDQDRPVLIPMRPKRLRTTALPVSYYGIHDSTGIGPRHLFEAELTHAGLMALEEAGESLDDFIDRRQTELLNETVSAIADNSMLVQMGMYCDERNDVHLIPWHANSLHHVAGRGEETLLIRPGRSARRHRHRFTDAITSLEAAINDPAVHEREIERILVEHPQFLHGLSYREIYSQVVLPRRDGSSLRPDIIAEPVGDDWAHIIDLKLPVDPILVGHDRPELAKALNAAAQQLREYQAYFDDRDLADRVEKKYGFRCYRPKMVVIIGRDPTRFSPDEQRLAMTAYPDLEFVTYDRLLRVARERPLY